VAAVCALLSAAPAAAEPCWRLVITDWSDGRIDNVYAPACYRAAIDKVPDSAETSVRRDLQRGLQSSLAAPAEARPASSGPSDVPVLIVIAAGGAFLLVSSARMIRAHRRRY
jgi:hypothetical protein